MFIPISHTSHVPSSLLLIQLEVETFGQLALYLFHLLTYTLECYLRLRRWTWKLELKVQYIAL